MRQFKQDCVPEIFDQAQKRIKLPHYMLYSSDTVGKVHESTQVPYTMAKVPMTPRGYGEMWPAWPQMSGMSLPAIPGNLPMR